MPDYSLQTVKKALDVLTLFQDPETKLTLTEVSQRVNLSVSVVFRILRVLCDEGYLERDPGTKRYCLGVRLWQFAARSQPHHKLRVIAQPHVDFARDATRETAALGVMSGTWLLYAATSPGRSALQAYIEPGTRAPAYPAASGRVLLAFGDPEVLESIIAAGLRPYTEETVTDADELRERIAIVSSEGVAVVHGEFARDVSSVAVPVWDRSGTCVAGLAVAGMTKKFTPEVVDSFKAVLDGVSQQLTAALPSDEQALRSSDERVRL